MFTKPLFKPKTWAFWRALVLACCICCLLGHWLEQPYCAIMDALFNIVEDDYAALNDPWFEPYYVYGYGAGAMTLVLQPLKEVFLRKNRNPLIALLTMFLLAILVAAFLETFFGILINQPDENGVYPFWDNSQLPLNILGQGWLVNDFFIGLVTMVYIWGIFPLTCGLLEKLGNKRADIFFGIFMVLFLAACFISFALHLI